MHSSLAPHLHTEECLAIIRSLHKCHEEHKYSKFWGACNDVKRALDKCLQKEYNEKRKLNYQKSLERKRRQEEKLERLTRPDSN